MAYNPYDPNSPYKPPPLGGGMNGGGNQPGQARDIGGGGATIPPPTQPPDQGTGRGRTYRPPAGTVYNNPLGGRGSGPFSNDGRWGWNGSVTATGTGGETLRFGDQYTYDLWKSGQPVIPSGGPGPVRLTPQQQADQAQQSQYAQDQADSYAAINAQLGQQAGLPQPGSGQSGANAAIGQLNQQAANTGGFQGMFTGGEAAAWQNAVDVGAISDALMQQLNTMPPDQAYQIAMNKVKEMNLKPGGNPYQWFG